MAVDLRGTGVKACLRCLRRAVVVGSLLRSLLGPPRFRTPLFASAGELNSVMVVSVLSRE